MTCYIQLTLVTWACVTTCKLALDMAGRRKALAVLLLTPFSSIVTWLGIKPGIGPLLFVYCILLKNPLSSGNINMWSVLAGYRFFCKRHYQLLELLKNVCYI